MKIKQLEECFNALLKNGELPTWRGLARMMGKSPQTIKNKFGGKFTVTIETNSDIKSSDEVYEDSLKELS